MWLVFFFFFFSSSQGRVNWKWLVVGFRLMYVLPVCSKAAMVSKCLVSYISRGWVQVQSLEKIGSVGVDAMLVRSSS